MFVKPTDENARAATSLSKLASASRVIVLGSSDPPPLTAPSSQGLELRHPWLDTLVSENSPPLKLFSKDIARIIDVVASLSVAIGPSSGAIDETVLHCRISSLRPSSAQLDSPCNFNRAVADSLRVPALPAISTSVTEHLDRSLPPVTRAPAASSRPSIVRSGSSRRLGGLPRSVPAPHSPFSSVSGFVSHIRDWLDGPQFAAVSIVSSFRGRLRLIDINWETPAPAWRKRRRGFMARDSEVIPLDR